MPQIIKDYVMDEDALDESVGKMLFILVVIVAIIAIGWFVWNFLSNKASVATDEANSTSNPGKGSEFSGNPFGN